MKFTNYLLKFEKEINQKHRESICLHGVSPIIKSIYLEIKNKHRKEIIKKLKNELGINYQTLYSWITGYNPIPISKAHILLSFWKEICEKKEEEFNEKWDAIYLNSQGYSQCAERKVLLPKELNNNLGYLIGFFQGDGHLKKEIKEGFQEYSIYFYEANKEFLNQINGILQKEFNVKGNIYLHSAKNGKCYTLRLTSKPIYIFLRDILGLRPGKKVRDIETSEIIKKSKLLIQLSFIKGFFDAEGGVGETKKNPWLEIGQASKNVPCEILIWIRDKLNENGVTLSKPYRGQTQELFRIRTAKRETIKKFFEVVSSEHPEKINKFKRIIEKCRN